MFTQSILTESGMYQQILVKFPNIKLHQNSYVDYYIQADMPKVMGKFLQLLLVNATQQGLWRSPNDSFFQC
jgi:hypothetical protein